ncbi:MAG: ComEA family DNA-binding protein [Candidatus Aegiribacteria sp.]|nr:ComEA family DNA-binding protein [Candidatus Aegiribacteria sp.]
MRILTVLLTASVIICTEGMAAFEPVFESPWLQGGVASTLFPRTPLVLTSNPACMALLEGHGITISAARPYGLKRLDRTAIAGCCVFSRYVLGAAISLSGDESYSEATAEAAVAWKLMNGVALGTSVSIRRLQISGYSRATGFSADISAVWTPADGVFGTALYRSVLRTDLGSSGDPSAPHSLELAVGVVPVENIVCAAGAGRQEELDIEYTFHTAFSPSPMISIATGIKTSPARFWAALELSLSSLSMEYGYGEHSSLPGTHSVALCWGNCASRPSSLHLSESEEQEEEPDVQFPFDINTATEEQLQLIPGIGPSKASAIASWLRQNGPVSSVNDLQAVPGIGPSMLEVLNEYLVAE